MILLRKTETPKFTKQEIAERFPTYTVVGDAKGWFFPVKDTRVVFVSYGFKSLVEAVRNHLVGNNIEVPDYLTGVIEDWWCNNVSAAECGEPTPAHVADIRTLAERFFRTFKSFVAEGGQKVPQDEAERRAATCAKCPLNVDDAGWCSGCFMSSIVAGAVSLVSGWGTSQDRNLKSCRLCGCKLSLKVHVPKGSMQYPELADKWPEWCWMRDDKPGSAQ